MLFLRWNMPILKQSDRVRDIVLNKYVWPALKSGSERVSVHARDVLKDAEASADFPRGRTPLVCNVLQSKKLLQEAGLEIEGIDGPPSRQSRKVVVHYRLVDGGPRVVQAPETHEEKANRLCEKLRGLMKDEIAAHGGAEGYIRWVRSDEDEE
jgi:hypothetical protein